METIKWRKYKAKKLAEDPNWEKKRHKDWRNDHTEYAREYGRGYMIKMKEIWRAEDLTKLDGSIQQNKERGKDGENKAVIWFKEHNFEVVSDLRRLWHAFPFDFLVKRKEESILVDVTIDVVKKIPHAKFEIARAFGIKLAVLFVRPNTSFAYLQMVQSEKAVYVPISVIKQLDKAPDI